ncbi:hypothetical protein ACTHGU_07425 [Chitinophagaceae bacterium MMS25-I14]
MAKEKQPEKNYCKGCGTSKSDLFHCQGRDCIENGDCSRTKSLSFVPTASTTQNQETSDMYNLRDEFLINFDLGQWYITYYYTLSQVAEENNLITKDNYQEYLTFGSHLLVAANTIRSGETIQVPITSELRTEAMVFVNRFRAVSTDPLIVGYLNNIEGDLEKFTGKDVNYIRTEIGL